MRKVVALVSVVALAQASGFRDVAAQGIRSGDQNQGAQKENTAGTPEAAYRAFFVAMIAKDKAALRALTLPTKDFDWLLRGKEPPAAEVEALRADVAKMPIRRLRAGEEIALPGNRRVTVRPDEVTAGRAVLLPQGSPVPTRCQKVDGQWRIDATPIIAARKAADAARRKGRG